MDWNNPAARLALIERVGPEAYNAAMAAHHAASAEAIVNGYAIRPVHSRFGLLHFIQGANVAFSTLDEAKAAAAKLSPAEAAPTPVGESLSRNGSSAP